MDTIAASLEESLQLDFDAARVALAAARREQLAKDTPAAAGGWPRLPRRWTASSTCGTTPSWRRPEACRFALAGMSSSSW